MPKLASYLELPKVKKHVLWTFFWAAVFFALINAAVYVVFDINYFDRVGHERLLTSPSDNEIRSLLTKARGDDRKQLVVLGDSAMWGIGLNDSADTTAAKLAEQYNRKRQAYLSLIEQYNRLAERYNDQGRLKQ